MADLAVGQLAVAGDSDSPVLTTSPAPVNPVTPPSSAAKSPRKPMKLKNLQDMLRSYPCFDAPGANTEESHLYASKGLLLCKTCRHHVVVLHRQNANQHMKTHASDYAAAHVAPMTPVLQDKKLEAATSVSLALAGVSYRSAEALRNSGFTNLVRLGPGIPERHRHAELIREFAANDLAHLVKQECKDVPVASAIDESTSYWPTLEERPRVLSIVCINLLSGREFCLYLTNMERCTGDTVRQEILKLTTDNILRPDQIWAVISDNAAYMTKCMVDLRKHPGFEHVQHLRCTAHTLSLQVKTLLGTLPQLQPTLAALSGLWSRSVDVRKALKSVLGSQLVATTPGGHTSWKQ